MWTFVRFVGTVWTYVCLGGTVWIYVCTVVTVQTYFAGSYSSLPGSGRYPDMYGLIYQPLNRQNNLSHIFNFTKNFIVYGNYITF